MADNEFTKKFPPSIARMQWPLTFSHRGRTHIGGIGSASYREPSPRDVLLDGLEYYYGTSPEARDRIFQVMERAEFFGGTPLGAYDASRAISEGRYKDAIVPAISVALPWLGRLKTAAKGFSDVPHGDEASDLTKARDPAFENSLDPRTPQILHKKPVPDKQLQQTHIAQSTAPAKSNLAAPSIIRPDNRLVVPKPSIILPDTRLVMPNPPVIQTMSGPRDWIDEAKFETSAGPGGRSTPWVVPRPPLAKAPRDSSLDYPNGVELDEHGRVRYDVDGRRIIAQVVAGRQRLGQKDVPITGAQIRQILKEMGVTIHKVPRDSIRKRGLGQYDHIHWTSPGRIDIWEGLPDDQADVVLAHEFGHFIDRKIGYPIVRGLGDELDLIYSENMTGQLNPPRKIHPRDNNYPRDEYRGEKMAEAIRTQLFQPNTMKTIGPKTAALLRKLINEHPILSRYLQVNGIPVGILAAAGAAATAANPRESQARQINRRDDATIPDVKHNLRKIVAALPAAVRRKPIPGTIELIARALSGGRTRPLHGGPR